jgi:glycosyltransferase involved in cell wall biosynthesis
MNYTLSIIIPCYKINQNKNYLNSLLNSIYSQKCNNIVINNIILVNDSPEYNLIDYIEPYNLSSKLIFENNKYNSGQAFSRNIGLNFVNSEYVHFIDQDDLIGENFYTNMFFGSDIIISKCVLLKNGQYLNHSKKLREFFLKRFTLLNKLRFFLIFDNIVLSPGQVIFKTGIIKKIKGFPHLANFGSDDFGLMYKLSEFNFSYVYNTSSVFFHRLHEIQGKNHLNMNASRIEFLGTVRKNYFSLLCSLNNFPLNYCKKFLYLIFYNRF